MRKIIKATAVTVLFLVTLPLAVFAYLLDLFNSKDQAFSSTAKLLSLIPGIMGRYIRTSFYVLTLDRCHYDLSIDFGSFFSKRNAIVGKRVVIGSYCIIGRASLGDNVLISSRVSVLSGKHQHSSEALVFEHIKIKKNCWIGENAIVMANIGYNCVVSAGSVVTKPMPSESLAVGNPARFSPHQQLSQHQSEQKQQLKSQLHIAHFRTSNFLGGPEKQIISHLNLLKKQSEHHISLISFDEPGGHVLKETAAKIGIDTFLLPPGTKDVSLVRRELNRWIAENDLDILCTHDYKSTFYGVLAKFSMKFSLVGFSRGATSESLKVKLYMWLDNQLLRFCDAIVAVSNSQAEKLSKIGIHHNSLYVIENAVTHQTFEELNSDIHDSAIRSELGMAEDDNIIISVGRLSEEKGHRYLLEAFEAFHQNCPNWHLLLVGDGPLTDSLKGDFKNQKNLHFLGFREDVPNLLKQSDIMVLPSLSEGLPNAVLEAISYHCPVIATRVGGVPDIICDQENGLLAPPADSKALQQNLQTLAQSPELRKQFIENALQTLEEKFSPVRQTNKLENLYKEVFTESR